MSNFKSLLAIAVALVSSAAFAAEPTLPQIERRVAVSAVDLNLSNPVDAAVMLERISRAARIACGVMAQRDPAYALSAHFVERNFNACREAAVARAVANLNSPALASFYANSHNLPDILRAARR